MRAEPRRFEPDPVIEAYKRDVDRTLIRESLRRSVEERLEALIELHGSPTSCGAPVSGLQR